MLPFVLFAFTMCATPGPNNAMLTASGASFGVRRTLPHLAGIALGFSLMVLLVAAGLGEALRAAPAIQEVMRWVGALYLLFLAVQIARAEPATPDAPSGSKPLTILQAALFQWVNPKAWVIVMGAIATYGDPGQSALAQALGMFAVFLVVSWPASAIWVLLGAGVARLLRTRRQLRIFNWLMAALLILSLVPTLTE